MGLPQDASERKSLPVTTGVLDYFPDAIAAVAAVSKAGNDQHNPGQPLHWAKEKSTDHADCIVRHLIERGTIDSDGQRHSAKVAWRALALLQTEIEGEVDNTALPAPESVLPLSEQDTPSPSLVDHIFSSYQAEAQSRAETSSREAAAQSRCDGQCGCRKL